MTWSRCPGAALNLWPRDAEDLRPFSLPTPPTIGVWIWYAYGASVATLSSVWFCRWVRCSSLGVRASMALGKIKKLVRDKGFGFIQSEGSQDIFFHHSTVADQGFDNLNEGQQVEYSVDQGGGGGGGGGKGPRAASVKPL